MCLSKFFLFDISNKVLLNSSMSVGFNVNKEIANIASSQNVSNIQQGNFKGHNVSLSEDSIIESFAMSNSINFPNKTLAERQVSVAH